MATKKLSKSHTSTRKKRPAKASTSSRTKKASSSRTKKTAATKAHTAWAQDKPPKPKKLTPEQLKKRMELIQRIFDAAYEANQRGEFQRL